MSWLTEKVGSARSLVEKLRDGAEHGAESLAHFASLLQLLAELSGALHHVENSSKPVPPASNPQDRLVIE